MAELSPDDLAGLTEATYAAYCASLGGQVQGVPLPAYGTLHVTQQQAWQAAAMAAQGYQPAAHPAAAPAAPAASSAAADDEDGEAGRPGRRR